MPTEAKKQEVAELVERIKRSGAIYIVEYRGLTVSKATAVRRLIKNSGGEMKVSKNTLMRIALKEASTITADQIDTGPNAYIFAYDDVAATAKAIRDFSKERGNEALVIKGGIMDGKILSTDQVMALADLPPRSVLIAQLLGVMNGPARGLVTVLSGTIRGLVTALDAIREKKEKAA